MAIAYNLWKNIFTSHCIFRATD